MTTQNNNKAPQKATRKFAPWIIGTTSICLAAGTIYLGTSNVAENPLSDTSNSTFTAASPDLATTSTPTLAKVSVDLPISKLAPPAPTSSGADTPSTSPQVTYIPETETSETAAGETSPEVHNVTDVEAAQITVNAPAEQAPAPTAGDNQALQEETQASSDVPAPVQPENPAPAPVIPAAPAAVNGITVSADNTITLTTISGSGTIPVTITRDPGAAAPNIPTYISSICDGTSVYSGAYNATAETLSTNISYAGSNCKIIASVKQPSAKWAGTYNASIIGVGAPNNYGGAPSVTAANWASRAVAGTDYFTLQNPAGFNGAVDLKLTACSSQGGTSDATAQYACGNLVQKGVGSSAAITLSDSSGTLAVTNIHISAERHHETIHLPLSRPATGPITITVTSTGGSAILVHGPGTRAVGTL